MMNTKRMIRMSEGEIDYFSNESLLKIRLMVQYICLKL